jgi:hypothetical protein
VQAKTITVQLSQLGTYAIAGVPDRDRDYCSDANEADLITVNGGERDPDDNQDFYDVPVPALRTNPAGTRNASVTLAGDVGSVLAYVGMTSAHADYAADYDANGVQDGLQYDRRPSVTPGKPWRSGAPDGAISLASDVAAALAQVGHSCAASP